MILDDNLTFCKATDTAAATTPAIPLGQGDLAALLDDTLLAQHRGEQAGQFRADGGAPVHGGVDQGEHFVRFVVFQDVAVGSGADGGNQIFRGIGDGDQDDARFDAQVA